VPLPIGGWPRSPVPGRQNGLALALIRSGEPFSGRWHPPNDANKNWFENGLNWVYIA
jgi:hypothetical protein